MTFVKKTPILGTGLSGLVGSRIVELLSERFEFEDLSFDTGVDITNPEQVTAKIDNSKADWILHLAAKADVDGCEADIKMGKDGAAWKINVEGTRNIVEAAQKRGKKVIYISTDFVFDGTQDFYTESDTPRPLNWYGQTKYEGEQVVLSQDGNVVARITYPYTAKKGPKKDFIRAILSLLSHNHPVLSLTDHVFTPTMIDDIALGLQTIINSSTTGIYHLVGGESLSPYDASVLIAQEFGYPIERVQKVKMKDYFKNRAPRPYKLATKNDRISRLGVKMRTFHEGLIDIKKNYEFD